MLFRLILLLSIGGGLILFTVFNWTPLLSLTFLGTQTPALPLALWILTAIAAGIVTSVAINLLFSTSNYLAVRQVRSQSRRTTRRSGFQRPASSPSGSGSSTRAAVSEDADADWKNWEDYEEASPRPSNPAPQPVAEDDWETPEEDDWGWVDDEPSQPSKTPRAAQAASSSASEAARTRTGDETQPQPKTASRSGSVYSYSYREPGTSGAGQREKVVDAEYRVIVPPYHSPSPPTTSPQGKQEDKVEEDAEDWFEDDNGQDSDRRR